MRAVIFIVNVCVGIAFGVVGALALTPAFAFSESPHIWTFGAWGAIGTLCAFAPTIRRGFGRGFLAVGAALFVLPLSSMVLSSAAFSEVMATTAPEDAAFAAIGAGAAGGMVTIIAGTFGFILGSLFLLIGLILALGGRREVIVVER